MAGPGFEAAGGEVVIDFSGDPGPGCVGGFVPVDRDDGLPEACGQVPCVAVVAGPHVPDLA